ncbi:MAG TPA: aminotransferase class V-fold PLP-dependent enzyme [Acidobacteriota bacterium]|nr:aminotransferase class V-fold PLP-dependent enzyme [Acidobacteriota bacterium]
MSRDVPLHLDREAFRAIGHRLVDQLADHLASVPARPVTPGEPPSAVRAALETEAPLPEKGRDAAALLEETTRLLFEHSLFNAHPRFFGYITSSPAPIGMLGDFVASALNPNVGAWTLSPAATEIEAQTIRWIAGFIGFPESCGGVLVSGGNMANLVCFFAARAAKAPWAVQKEGARPPGRGRLRAYASKETHTWLQKAADLSGIGTDAVRWIETDASQRIDVEALRRAIAADRAAGDIPFLVVGTAGSVSTGAVDPLPRLAALCREESLWFHVDGAYGGIAAAVPEAPDDLRGLAEADSVAVDPHKWLYAPLEAGCALVRDAEAHRAAFSYHPPYYHFKEQSTNYVDYGMQNSRGFRALKVWLAFRQAGAEGHRRLISDDIRLAGVMAEAIVAEPSLDLKTRALSIVTFRYVPRDLRARAGEADVAAYLDRLNQALLDALQRGGEVFVSNAVVGERYLLRACIVNFNTDERDVAALPEVVVRRGEAVDRDLRPEALPAAR